MVLDPKHFDDIDDFCDFDDKLDASSEGELSDNGPGHPLSWRRIIIEKAASNVKKAVESKTDLRAAYKKGSLVFDEQANRFGRVLESRPGFLNMSLVAGGKLLRQDISPSDFVREHRHKLTLSQMAEKLAVTETEVVAFLNQLEQQAEKSLAHKAKLEAKKPLKKSVAAKEKKEPKKKPEIKVAMPAETAKKSKPIVKIAAKKKELPIKKKGADKEGAISFTKLLPKGATTDPVMDPNGYIQQNFLMMSNRELARATGLSEHTIRRKLGEWNLKRKDFVNKA